MAMVLVRVNVAYPKESIDRLKENESEMQSAGMKAASISVLADKHNVLYIIFTWNSVGSARTYWSSATGKSTLNKLHSVETPEILILEEPIQL